MGLYCFGIDVGGTSIKCGLFTTEGALVEKWEIPTRHENDGALILPDVADTIKEKLEELGVSIEEVDGVGIGIPGPVNQKGETPVAVNLHWGFKAVAAELSALTGLHAKAANDANVAALGESWKGAAAGAKNVLLVTLGTGVGGGVIVEGKILAGHHGAGGEIGHALINRKEKIPCNCGNRGCLEQYCSATGIVRLANEYLEMHTEDSPLRQLKADGILEAKHVLDAYKDGDEMAVKIMERFGDLLGSALAIFATVTDPEAIVVGGGVSKAGKPLTDLIQKYFDQYAFSACKGTPIIRATLGNDAGIYGAACMVLKEE